MPALDERGPAYFTISALALVLAITAFAGNGIAFAQTDQARLTIATVDDEDNSIFGYYTLLMQNGEPISSGFTTADFDVSAGQEYAISVSDFGDYVFDHWQDGSDVRDRLITITSDTVLTAVYRNLDETPDTNPDPEPEPEPEEDIESSVIIRTIGSEGSEISGYYTLLMQEGTVISSGFSPAEFMVSNGEQYSVSVSDYGSYFFNEWEDTGNDDRERTVEINSDSSELLTLVAVYESSDPSTPDPDPEPDQDPEPEPIPSGEFTLTVKTADGDASNEISGYYVVLFQEGSMINSGFSAISFDLSGGQDYSITVSDYGDYVFDHWDSGSTARERTVSIAEDTEIVAIYINTNGDPQQETEPEQEEDPEPEPEPEPAPSGQSTISVDVADLSDNALTGYYITLSQNGETVDSGFSPEEFVADNGETYQLAVSDFGYYVFDHWEDSDSAERERSVEVTSDVMLTAVFRNINGNAPPEPNGSTELTVYAYRMPSPHWGATFTSAGANMFFGLYDSFGNLIRTGFGDENGLTFTGLESGSSYYVYPADCGGCHNSNHDVMFRHWENGSTERPREVTTGQGVDAYFEYVPWS